MSHDGAISRLDPDLIRIPEAALEFGISRTTIWKWVADGKIQGFRSGRNILVRRSDLTGMLEVVPYQPRPRSAAVAPDLASA